MMYLDHFSPPSSQAQGAQSGSSQEGCPAKRNLECFIIKNVFGVNLQDVEEEEDEDMHFVALKVSH